MSDHRRREPNPYGFLTGKKVPWAGVQLQALLKLQNNEEAFQIIKGDITSLILKHMDFKLKGAMQVENLRAIETDLKEQHPEIFATEESEKRLYFVIRLVLHEHSTRRSRYNRQNEKLGCSCSAATQKSPISMHNNKTNRQSKVESRHGATIESEPIVVDSDDDHEMSVEPVSHILSQSKELRAGSEHDNPGMSMSKSASQTLPRSNESSMSTKSQITHKKHDPNQYHDLNNFLETTMPPMTYLLDAFIEFGCVNADYLRAISTWSFEAIRGVLDRLSFGPDGKRLTEMEKFILQNHFKEYFTQLKKGGNTVHNSES